MRTCWGDKNEKICNASGSDCHNHIVLADHSVFWSVRNVKILEIVTLILLLFLYAWISKEEKNGKSD